MTIKNKNSSVTKIMRNGKEIVKAYSGSNLLFQNIKYIEPGTVLYQGESFVETSQTIQLNGVMDGFKNLKNGILVEFDGNTTKINIPLFGDTYIPLANIKFPSAFSNPLQISQSQLNKDGMSIDLYSKDNGNVKKVVGGLLPAWAVMTEGHIRINPIENGKLQTDMKFNDDNVVKAPYKFVIKKITAL